jgi:hypothetical protein
MLNGCFCGIGVSGGERVRSIPRIATCVLGELFVGALRLGHAARPWRPGFTEASCRPLAPRGMPGV